MTDDQRHRNGGERTELDKIEAELRREKYELDLDELKDGWGAVYRHKDSRIGSRTPHFGKTKLEAARKALAKFRDEQRKRKQ